MKRNWLLLALFLLLAGCAPPTGTAPSGTTYTPTEKMVPTDIPTLSAANPTYTPVPLPSPTTLTFPAEADARVYQAAPTTNYGTSTYLQVDGETSGSGLLSYIRFTVSGVTGPIQSAKLRVFCTTNGTSNGPAAYLAGNDWTESGSSGITWNNQPSALSTVYDNKDAISTNSWVEYNVKPLLATDGTYSFVLAADSNDGVTFSSREGSQPPELVISFDAGVSPTAGP